MGNVKRIGLKLVITRCLLNAVQDMLHSITATGIGMTMIMIIILTMVSNFWTIMTTTMMILRNKGIFRPFFFHKILTMTLILKEEIIMMITSDSSNSSKI